MKRCSLFIALPVMMFTAQPVFSADTDCAALEMKIEQKIALAKANDDDNSARGYQSAFDDLQKKCDIADLIKQTQQQLTLLENQISKTQVDVEKTDNDLAAALTENNLAKINKIELLSNQKQALLEEQQDALEIAEAKLAALQIN